MLVRILEPWNDAKAYFLEYQRTSLNERNANVFLDSNKKYQRIKSRLGANEKTTLIEMNFIMAIAQPVEKYLLIFQGEGPLIHLFF